MDGKGLMDVLNGSASFRRNGAFDLIQDTGDTKSAVRGKGRDRPTSASEFRVRVRILESGPFK